MDRLHPVTVTIIGVLLLSACRRGEHGAAVAVETRQTAGAMSLGYTDDSESGCATHQLTAEGLTDSELRAAVEALLVQTREQCDAYCEIWDPHTEVSAAEFAAELHEPLGSLRWVADALAAHLCELRARPASVSVDRLKLYLSGVGNADPHTATQEVALAVSTSPGGREWLMNRIVIESHPLLIGADIRALAESPSEALLITSGTLVDELRRDPQVPVSHKFALGGTVSGVLQTMRAIENYDGLHTTDERALFLCREALSNCPIGFGSEDSECDLRSASRPPNARWAIGKLYGLSVAEPAAVAAIVKHSAFESMLLDESGAPTIDAERRLKRIDSCRNLIVTVLSPDCQDAYNNN